MTIYYTRFVLDFPYSFTIFFIMHIYQFVHQLELLKHSANYTPIFSKISFHTPPSSICGSRRLGADEDGKTGEDLKITGERHIRYSDRPAWIRMVSSITSFVFTLKLESVFFDVSPTSCKDPFRSIMCPFKSDGTARGSSHVGWLPALTDQFFSFLWNLHELVLLALPVVPLVPMSKSQRQSIQSKSLAPELKNGYSASSLMSFHALANRKGSCQRECVLSFKPLSVSSSIGRGAQQDEPTILSRPWHTYLEILENCYNFPNQLQNYILQHFTSSLPSLMTHGGLREREMRLGGTRSTFKYINVTIDAYRPNYKTTPLAKRLEQTINMLAKARRNTREDLNIILTNTKT
ncbi:uncharacterized protein BDR25DRAFT_360288 [Lindgomyces ingoldianus]|uniref:Uncharacterized protein n=1 Tax=Lindgomyces ingoldianus TaxID=673940 RepID=A0ACB6QFT5_9PLEO|nr:uncharacterized protein BDR25DRAFT_360288 [Lindgomyces ingoldianus]KAF2465761.1 hypothetical protein BDR25DRAFT_360288 [Lindgomyces ingoldianus]